MIRVFTNSQIKKLESDCDKKAAGYALLMEYAGEGISKRLLADHPDKEKYFVFCGKGRNGGDGFVAARYLSDAGKTVYVVKCFDSDNDELSESMRAKLADTAVNEIDLDSLRADDSYHDSVILDCVFGIGFRGLLTGTQRRAVRLINACGERGAAVVSADVPSGVGEAGLPEDGLTVVSERCYTMIGLKRQMLSLPVRRVCGKITVIDIIDESFIKYSVDEDTFAVDDEDVARVFSHTKYDSNKGDMGRVLLLGGSYRMPGALSFASSGALRVGTGLITLAFPETAYPAVAPNNVHALLEPLPADDSGLLTSASLDGIKDGLSRYDCVAAGFGMGLGTETGLIVRTLLDNVIGSLLLDADALNAVARDSIDLRDKRAKALIVTPHPGEMSRLTGLSIDQIVKDPVSVARSFALKNGCFTILKVANTVTACPDGTVFVNYTGSPALSRGGAGDLLSGIVAGLAARANARDACAVGVFTHGSAAQDAEEIYGQHAADVKRTAEHISAHTGRAVNKAGIRAVSGHTDG